MWIYRVVNKKQWSNRRIHPTNRRKTPRPSIMINQADLPLVVVRRGAGDQAVTKTVVDPLVVVGRGVDQAVATVAVAVGATGAVGAVGLIDDVTALKQQANGHYKAGERAVACAEYARGLGLLEKAPADATEEQAASLGALELALRLNSAACSLSEGAHAEALTHGPTAHMHPRADSHFVL